MGRKALTALVLSFVLLSVVSGCAPVDDERSAVKALSSTSEKKRQAGLDFLVGLPEADRIRIGMSLFLSPDPLAGHAGIRLLSSAALTADDWLAVEAKVNDDPSRLARRYAILASRTRRSASIPILCNQLPSCGEADAVVVIQALSDITGLDFGSGDRAVVAARWTRFAQRRSKGVDLSVDRLLSAIYVADTPESAVKALRAIPIGQAAEVLPDLKDIALLFAPVLEREIALMLADASDDGSVLMLFSMLSSPDYLVRFNSYNSLVKRTGIAFKYDPGAAAEQREAGKTAAGKLLGIDR